jgi:hypothetical protein
MDIPRKELELGIKDETGEHGMSKKQAKKTAIDHLRKNKNYYSKLKSIGLEEMENVEEDFDTSINVEGGSIDINDDAVLDAVNRKLAGLTTKSCITPYIKLQKIRELLAYYNIFLPQTVFLEGDDGNEVFEISQFGEKIGMDNQGVVKKKNSDGLYLYFEWVTNDSGMIDVFAEIVDKEELEELLSDFKEENDDGEDDDEDSDGAETSFDTYKASNMNEDWKATGQLAGAVTTRAKWRNKDWENKSEDDKKKWREDAKKRIVNSPKYQEKLAKMNKKSLTEDDMDLFDDDDKPKKKEKKAKAFVHKTSGKEIKSVGKAPSGDWKKLKEERLDEISAGKAEKAYQSAKNKLLDNDIMVGMTKGATRKKWLKKSDKRRDQAVKFANYAGKKRYEAGKKLDEAAGKDILKTVKEERLDEISQKKATNSYVSGTDFEYDDHPKAEKILSHIRKKFGAKAEKNAVSAADVSYWGRGTPRPGRDALSGGLRAGRGLSNKLTKSGKIPKNTQKGMKNIMKKDSWSYRKPVGPKGYLPEDRLDELKDATHMSYRAKARNQIDKMANRLGNKMMADTVDTKKMKNRADGIKQSYKLQPGLKKKKLKEANEPFEGPYVQKGKEKSNPDRRASTIAHKALKAVKKKMNKGETEKQWRKRMQDRYETLQYKGD